MEESLRFLDKLEMTVTIIKQKTRLSRREYFQGKKETFLGDSIPKTRLKVKNKIYIEAYLEEFLKKVRTRGFEPPHPNRIPAPQAGASTNSAMCA